jgi:hypothetical protein
LVCSLGGVAVIGLAILIFGGVTGVEFSPDGFQRRWFYYHEIPLLRIQVWPISRSDLTNDLQTHLLSEKLVPPTKPEGAQRWHLVSVSRIGGSRTGDAQILCSYLDSYRPQGDLVWLDWTKKHPDLAKVLWPAIAELAAEQLYVFVPELIDLAKSAQGEADLQARTDLILAERYGQLADAQQELGNHARALALYDLALPHTKDHDPLRKRLHERRRKSADLVSPHSS